MHVLRFFPQIVSIAFTRTYMCNITWRSFTFPKNLISSCHSDSEKSLMLKIYTYVHTSYSYIHTHILPSSETGVPLLLLPAASCPPRLFRGFSWPFITGAGVRPQADISTSTHQVSTVSLLWQSCSRWCKWPGT